MTDDRLPTALWVSALIRRCVSQGAGAYVARKGAEAAGTVLLRQGLRDGSCRIFFQARDAGGALSWMPAFDGGAVDGHKAGAYIDRARKTDPDVWVVEIEADDAVFADLLGA